MRKLLIVIRFLIFVPIAPLIVLGSLVAMFLGGIGVTMATDEVPVVVGWKWLISWWRWITGEITTRDFIG